MSLAVPLYGFGASGGAGGALTITAPANVTVTITKDGKTKTKPSGTSGVVVFKGLANGKWTVSTTKDGAPITRNVDITSEYSTTIGLFSATISITYPAGSSCTCSDGATEFSAPDTSGTWTCTVPNAGTWTVTSTNGDKSKSADVAITTDGQSESVTLQYILYLFKDGVNVVEWTYRPYDYGVASLPNMTLATMQSQYGEGNARRPVFYTTNKIDVTNYKTMTMEVGTASGSGKLEFAILSDDPNNINNNDVDISADAKVALESSISSAVTKSVDLSSFTGKYYVVVRLRSYWTSGYTASINNIYLV